jgi:hypothetical protein
VAAKENVGEGINIDKSDSRQPTGVHKLQQLSSLLLPLVFQQALSQCMGSIRYPLKRWECVHVYEQHMIRTGGLYQVKPKQGQTRSCCNKCRTTLHQFTIIVCMHCGGQGALRLWHGPQAMELVHKRRAATHRDISHCAAASRPIWIHADIWKRVLDVNKDSEGHGITFELHCAMVVEGLHQHGA